MRIANMTKTVFQVTVQGESEDAQGKDARGLMLRFAFYIQSLGLANVVWDRNTPQVTLSFLKHSVGCCKSMKDAKRIAAYYLENFKRTSSYRDYQGMIQISREQALELTGIDEVTEALNGEAQLLYTGAKLIAHDGDLYLVSYTSHFSDVSPLLEKLL